MDALEQGMSTPRSLYQRRCAKSSAASSYTGAMDALISVVPCKMVVELFLNFVYR